MPQSTEIYVTLKYFTGTCKLTISHYHDNKAPAIILQDGITGERIATASVNPHNSNPQDGNVIIKDWSENEGMAEALLKAGMIQPAENFRQHVCGYCIAEEYAMTPKLLELWNKHKEEVGLG